MVVVTVTAVVMIIMMHNTNLVAPASSSKAFPIAFGRRMRGVCSLILRKI